MVSSDVFEFISATFVSIFLVNNQITTITAGSFYFSSSTSYLYFYYGSNKIASVPSGAFESNIYLYLVTNRITTLIPGGFKFPLSASSISLYLSNNKITSVPSNAFNFLSVISLISLYLDGNQMTNITPAGSIYCSLSNNKIASVPSFTSSPSVLSCTAFKFLFATPSVTPVLDNNQITSLPDGLFNFPIYISISLKNNRLVAIPSAVLRFPLAATVIISLSSNKIASITITLPLNFL